MSNIPFRVIPAICFDCPGCGNRHIRVDRNLPDITRTGVTCQRCHAQYDVLWDDIVEQSRVVLRSPSLVRMMSEE
jgi:hypothetical protein